MTDDIVARLYRLTKLYDCPELPEAAAEIERLRERLGPRGLEVVMIDGAGHYVNEKVKTEIERLRDEVKRLRLNAPPQKDAENGR